MFGENQVLESSFWAPDVLPADRVLAPSIIQESPNEVELFIDSERQTSCFRCGFFALEPDLRSH